MTSLIVTEIIKKTRSGVSSVSRETYMRSILSLMKKLCFNLKKISDVELLFKDNKSMLERIEKLTESDNSLKNMINSMVILAEFTENPENIAYWRKQRDAVTDKIKTVRSTLELTADQKTHFVTTEQYNQVMETIKNKLKNSDYFKEETKCNGKAVCKLAMQYMLLLIYEKFNIRADVAYLKYASKVYFDSIKNKGERGENYLVYSFDPKLKKGEARFQFVLMNSKTVKNDSITYNFDSSPFLVKFMKQYLKNVPCDVIFWKKHDGVYRSFTEEEISKFFRATFMEFLEKGFTITMNRIRLASANPENIKLKEMLNSIGEESKDALHSTAQHLLYVKKTE